MTKSMAMPPAVPPSWCPSCGQPWETHWRCPPPPRKRETGKLIVLAFLVGVVLVFESLLLAAYLSGALMRPDMVTRIGSIRLQPAGPLRPMLQSCELFHRWERTHHPSLLNRAVSDAHSPRVPQQYKLRLRTDLGGLRSWTREAHSAHSPTTVNYEHAIEAVCAPLVSDYRHARRHHHGSHRSQVSPSPGPTKGMSS